jgi:hypothetical protein
MKRDVKNCMMDEQVDGELEAALSNFRRSVHAWSDAEYHRVRPVAAPTRVSFWRPAAGWALASVVLLGVATGGIEQHLRQVEIARQAAHQAELEREAKAAKAAEDVDSLLANVDRDVSRQLPAAMDALDDDSRQ